MKTQHPEKTTPAGELPEVRQPTDDEIRARAYHLYLARAGAAGDCLSDWLQAEDELRRNPRPLDAPPETVVTTRDAREQRSGARHAVPVKTPAEKEVPICVGYTAKELCSAGKF